MRTKYILQAPEGVSESVIEGTPYWPDEDGRVETTNPNHVPVLKLHGYTVVTEVKLAPPVRTRTHAAIDVEDLGRTGLVDALQARGVSYPEAASRQDLAEIAQSWNAARAMPAEAPRPAPPAAPVAAPAPAPAPVAQTPAAAPEARAPSQAANPHDFSTYGYEDLKGWLAGRGVEFPGNAAKKVLIDLAQKYHAKHGAPAPAEAEAV